MKTSTLCLKLATAMKLWQLRFIPGLTLPCWTSKCPAGMGLRRRASYTIACLTVFGRPGYLRRALDQGAVGFVLKDASPSVLVDAIRRTAVGERVIDPQLAVATLKEGENPLTPREREILAMSASGSTAGELARALHLSEGTVRNHLSLAIQKLHARTRLEAIRLAQEKGWL